MHRSLGLLATVCASAALLSLPGGVPGHTADFESVGGVAGAASGNVTVAASWPWMRGRFVVPPPVGRTVRFESARFGFGCHHVDLPVASDGSFRVSLDPRWLGLEIVIAADALSTDGTMRFSYSGSLRLAEAREKGETIELGDLMLTAEAPLRHARRH